jgi:uncharacterized protein (DUF885 family)
MSDASEQLQQLIDDHWEAWMQADPLFATSTGDHRYNDRLPHATDDDYQAWLAQQRAFRERQRAIDREALAPGERLDYDIFARLLDNEIRDLEFRAYCLPISKAAGFHISFPDLHLLSPFDTAQDYANFVARLKGFRRYVQENIALMRAGMQSGYLPAAATLVGVEGTIQPHLVQDPAESVFFQPFRRFPPTVSPAEQGELAAAARAAIEESIVPGYQDLLDFVVAEYRPAARVGVAADELPDGRAFYEHRVRYFTSLDLSPEQVHATGLAEVKRIRAEMEALMRQTGLVAVQSGSGLARAIEFLRTEPRFYAQTPEQLLKEVAYVLKRMDGELPRLFKTLPRLPYGIRPIPDFSAPGNTTAYYQPGTGDGSRAGVYYVNTYDLKSRPLYEIEALSLHEAVPGHHLQIALQQELEGLPKFRRFGGFTAFVEGWALYAERLGLEVGFYQDPYSDFGRLSYEMWRACRLVVDPGMHVLGWTRQQAIDFMAENTASTLLNIANEVDRYIAWPGQALAYKIGELKIRELRTLAEGQLGVRFNLREFHDLLLGSGAVPLDMLEAMVNEWIGSQR